MKKRKKLTEAQRQQRRNAITTRWTKPPLTAKEATETRADRPDLSLGEYVAQKQVTEGKMLRLLGARPGAEERQEHPPAQCRWCKFQGAGKDRDAKCADLASHVTKVHPDKYPPGLSEEEVRQAIKAKTPNWWG